MIFKDELKHAIKEYFKSKVSEKIDAWELVDICAGIQKIIDDLDANPWNPVEESVPTDSRYILLHFENFSLPAIGRYEEDKDGGGAFYVGDDDENCLHYGLFVNAWMELPERYCREQEKEKGY